jgi:hypothetical protein
MEYAVLALGDAFGNFEGIDAIVASAHQNWSQMPHMHHWMANTLINLEGSRHCQSRGGLPGNSR